MVTLVFTATGGGQRVIAGAVTANDAVAVRRAVSAPLALEPPPSGCEAAGP